MKDFRFVRLFSFVVCALLLFSSLSLTGTACRGTAPAEPKEEGSTTPDASVQPDGRTTPPPDERSTPTEKDTTPKELTIMDIQDSSSANHAGKGAAVVLKGVVVVSSMIVVSSNTGLKGFFVVDGSFPVKKFGGILVIVDPDFSEELKIGDKLNIEGAVDEFSDNTQVVARASRGGSITKDGSVDITSIKPAVVTPEDIPGEADKASPDSSKAEPYESVLVELKDVEVMEAADQFGVWKLKGGVVVDDTFFRFRPKVGDKFPFIRGVIYYSFETYRLLPRNASDISGATPECTADTDCRTGSKCINDNCRTFDCTADSDCRTGETCNNSSKRCELPEQTVTVADVQNPAASKYVPTNNPVKLKGVVVTSGMVSVSANLNGFWVSDPAFPKEWGGVQVVVGKTWPETVEVGDVIDIKGRTAEFFDNTQVSVNTMEGGSITKTGTNKKDEVKATELTLADLPPKPADAAKPNESPSEKYEGMLVELKDVTVSAEADNNGEWKVDGDLVVDDLFFKATPKTGDKFKVLRGIVQFSFGSYRILPRDASDLVQ